MFTKARCPKCENAIAHVTVDLVEIRGAGTNYRGVCYFCDSCGSVLSIEIDPLGLQADLLRKLGKG
jgi:hypothetical protein